MNYSNFELAKTEKLVNNGTEIMLEEPQTGWPFEKKLPKTPEKVNSSDDWNTMIFYNVKPDYSLFCE